MTAPANPKSVDIRSLIKEEYKKCAVDPAYFMKRYCYIQHPKRGRLLFDLYQYQTDSLAVLKDNDQVIVLKARQLGFTTLVACYSLWFALFHTDKNILVIATKQETAKNLITKSRFAFDHLPVWLKSKCVENNKLNLVFSNGSQIKAVSSATDSGRSEAVSILIVDEAAFIENAEEIWISAQATLSTGGRSIIISTPNGVGNFFHQTWAKSEAGQNNFKRIHLDWRNHPERDEEWHEKELRTLGPRGFRQEHEAEFLGSGNTVFDADLVQFYKQTFQQDPVEKTGFDGNLWIWEQPNYNRAYLISADVARGDGMDFSAFHVIDAEKCTQVAEYRGKLDTTMFGHMLIEMAVKYNDAMLVVENANQGWAVIQVLLNREYRHIFYMNEDVRVIDEMDPFITNKWNQRERKRVPGFTTSMRTKPLIISKLDEYLRNKDIGIRSARTLNEMDTFIWNNGKSEAQEGYNDDLIMSLAIGLWVRDTSLKLYDLNMEIQRKAVEGFTKVSGADIVYRPTGLQHDPFKMNVNRPINPYGDNDAEDFRWLLGGGKKS